MPVYNAGPYLKPALLSILNQSFPDWELILVDDGSTDGCFDGLDDVLLDSRICLVRDGLNKGIAARLNEIIDMARGHYLARMDADDISHPQRFEEQVSMIEADDSLDLIATRAQKIDFRGSVLGELPYKLNHHGICSEPFKGFYMAHPTWMGKLEWFKNNKYSEHAPYLCEDQDLLLRTYAKSKFATVNEVLFSYRVSSSVNLCKLLKTRFSYFRCQYDYFLASKSYVWLTRAAFIFCARITKDLTRKLYSLFV